MTVMWPANVASVVERIRMVTQHALSLIAEAQFVGEASVTLGGNILGVEDDLKEIQGELDAFQATWPIHAASAREDAMGNR